LKQTMRFSHPVFLVLLFPRVESAELRRGGLLQRFRAYRKPEILQAPSMTDQQLNAMRTLLESKGFAFSSQPAPAPSPSQPGPPAPPAQSAIALSYLPNVSSLITPTILPPDARVSAFNAAEYNSGVPAISSTASNQSYDPNAVIASQNPFLNNLTLDAVKNIAVMLTTPIPVATAAPTTTLMNFSNFTTASPTVLPAAQPSPVQVALRHDSALDCQVGDWTDWGNCRPSADPQFKSWMQTRYRPVWNPHYVGGLPCLPTTMRRACIKR